MSTSERAQTPPSAVVLADFGAGPELVVSRCEQCGAHRYPPRALCVEDLEPMVRVPASHEGSLAVAVHVDRPPQGFSGDFWLGYVDLPEGVRVFSQIDPGTREPAPGTRVRYEIRTVRTEPYPVRGPVFVPVEPEGDADVP